jgi:hypothetical protein
VGSDGDKTLLLPLLGDDRTNLVRVRTLDGAEMSGGVVPVVRACWCRCNLLAHSSCTTSCPLSALSTSWLQFTNFNLRRTLHPNYTHGLGASIELPGLT